VNCQFVNIVAAIEQFTDVAINETARASVNVNFPKAAMKLDLLFGHINSSLG
jgi:hypothetical protein